MLNWDAIGFAAISQWNGNAFRSYVLVDGAGIYSLAGAIVGFPQILILITAVGTYATTGIAAAIGYLYLVSLGVAAYATTGAAAVLQHGMMFIITAGTYFLQGFSTSGGGNVFLYIFAGAYTSIGNSNVLAYGWRALAGVYTVAGGATLLGKAIISAATFIRNAIGKLQRSRVITPTLYE